MESNQNETRPYVTLSDKGMLVRLSISQWTARRHDKEISQEVATIHNASANAGRYHKCLIDPLAIRPIQVVSGNARTFHYTNTLPWDDSDNRLLPAKNFLTYSQKMGDFRSEFEASVNKFVSDYPQLVEAARYHLNGMFRSSDYPHESRIADKFSFSFHVSPLPEAGDFRVTLQAEDIAEIKADIEQRNRLAQETVMIDLWQRLHDTVRHMVDKLSDSDAIFRDSLVSNVAELCSLLPRLNIMDDTSLETARQEIESKLLTFDAQTLRDNPFIREGVAKEASSILSAMSGYLGKVQ